ncbi:hypothetical protein H2O64_05655 [Kordia sp. YSTF-M3]|uniref:Bacteriocin n=1 Tax=Kordia aestuariivivens TaxID=2759037 RepID=A0ABR7Q6J8_9FLAO|nr:hypothetical protein [Kordia aestuariivivens]MBC8754147.1 hypothetical protein [Kordia aestuariivivens]
MKKKNLYQKLRIQKSKIASFNQMNTIYGGGRSNPCDSIETMDCPTNTCPPGSNGCNTANCPPETAECPSANTICLCNSFITDPGITGC